MCSKVTEVIEGWVCQDCLMLIANGELNPDLTEEECAAYIKRVQDYTKNDDAVDIALGDEQEDLEFSNYTCDSCGTSLGGSRHHVNFIYCA